MTALCLEVHKTNVTTIIMVTHETDPSINQTSFDRPGEKKGNTWEKRAE